MTFSFLKWTNGSLKETIAAFIACSSQIWIGGGFVSMQGMPDVSKVQFGWLVATSQIVEFFMIAPGLWMSPLLGKKAVLQMAAVPSIGAYMLLSQADHIVDLFIARILQGISSGLINGVLPLYLSDIASEKTRGVYNHFQITLWYLGVTLIYATSPFLAIQPVTLILLALALVWSLLMTWLPESPWYYVERGREAKALDSLSWLRGSQDLARREYDTSVSNRFQASWKELISKQTVVITAVAILQFAFVPAWIAHSNSTLLKLTNNYHSAIGIQLAQAIICFLTSTISSYLLSICGRKVILLTSLTIAFLSAVLSAVSLYYITGSEYINKYLIPIIITLIIIYPILSSLIFHPITYTLSFEILYHDKHTKILIYLSTLSAFFTAVSCSIVPILTENNYDFINFSILSGTIFIVFIVISVWLPETKNKHIFEINRLFRS